MVPQPKKQTPQRQPLTVALRKICKDYPAGAGILRELLQNADDAGASTIKFVLDTRTHPDSPLLVNGLSEYQGPALLAYNDGLFTEKDFQSLSSLADSKKIQDKAATGKFGLGFSSVFNWTDSPSILSGSTLLFLDPHNSWSREFNPPGGPLYEFPLDAKEMSMSNQLACFSFLNTDWEKPFQGTIIRIPLRDAAQAGRSEISKVETTQNDVRDAIDSFANEMGSNGLLFLKSVRRIVLSVDDEQLNEVEVINRLDLTGPNQRLKDILVQSINDESQTGGEVYHEIHLRHRVAGQETVKSFGILNLVAGSTHDHSLQSWAASEKLFPWVAVAAPLRSSEGNSESGRLFSTLPLPVSTGLPVHIHGLFSITPDRSRLHGLDDSGVQDHRPKEWNQLLFDQHIPTAWAKLLLNICRTHPTHDHSLLWPSGASDTLQLWDGMCPAVMRQVVHNHLPVWFSHIGYIALEDGLLASDDMLLSLRVAFREAKLPVIFATSHILGEACQLAGSRVLDPQTLYHSLRDIQDVSNLSNTSKLALLEYLLPDISLTDLGNLEIFPFQDGKFRSLKLPAVFLHRNDLEKTLFTLQEDSSIDTDQLSKGASILMHDKVKQDNQKIRYRNPEDLRDYYLQHIANGSEDTVVLDGYGMSTLSQVWRWILQYSEDKLPLTAIGSLWLVPLRDCVVRRLVPTNPSNFATWFRTGQVNDVAHEVLNLYNQGGPKVLATDALTEEIMQHLLIFAENEQALCLKDGNKFENFLEFLAQGRCKLQTSEDDLKKSVLLVLKQLCWSQSNFSTDRECSILKNLCLFRAIEWPADPKGLSMRRYWTHLSSDTEFIGFKAWVPVPSSAKQVFIDVTDEGERALFEGLGLLKCLNDREILEDVALPAMQNGSYERFTPSFRLEAVELLFENYYRISATKRSLLPKLEVVPLENRRTDSTLSFGCPLDVLDPHQPLLRNLYFEDEIFVPERGFYNRFSAVLAECGMIRCLNDRVVLDRIRKYGRNELQFGKVPPRAKHLLQLPFERDSAQPDEFIRIARETKWLPARNPDRSESLTLSSQCRDKTEESVLGYVWSILPFRVDKSWRTILGWQTDIDVDVLLSQLENCIRASDTQSAERTLSYLYQNHRLKKYVDRLLKLNFVRDTEGKLVGASKVCRRGAEKLLPYLRTVDPRFWDTHTKIMNSTNIAEAPTLEQLKDVQNALHSTECLTEPDLNVAVEVARIWGDQFSESLEGLKMPDHRGMLADVNSLLLNDAPWVSAGDRAFVHPRISQDTTHKLSIQPLSELLRDGALGITDPDDDEFYQREEVADGIRDTLDRYTRESTFHEYLANADDCEAATEVNFLLDTASYGTETLITKDLGDLQGPSLLIHNDGVFNEKDFEGLKHVGRGSKRDDPNSIGKFGRGSQTMFHWTDVPMILSGPYLLILDPLRKYLPYSYRTRQKKPGVLLRYANLKASCPDQLAPFETLWGFDSSQDSYKGTIFRFPLRREGQGSELLESQRCPDVSTTTEIFSKIFDEARLALLFLRNLTTIDFSMKRGPEFEWRVRRGIWPQNGTFSDWATVLVEHHSYLGKLITTNEQWWRVMVDVYDAPANLQYRHKRRMKYVECGIAALVSQEEKPTVPCLPPLKSRFFNCLPLKFESTLPVHVHATFLLSGDRQNIATEETSQDAGAQWNRWLLQKQLPLVYLHFLEDLGRKIGENVYNYFPTVSVGDLLSDLIRNSFWGLIQSSTRQLLPVMEASVDTKNFKDRRRSIRRAPNLVTFERAVFNLLDHHTSKTLQPLLCKCLEGLVCPPPVLKAYFKRIDGVNTLTPALVRGILKSTVATQAVEEAKERDETFLKVLLAFIMPNNEAEFMELDGCQILPLANGNLGTLSLTSKPRSDSDKLYFSANAECYELFSFASSLLANNQRYEKFVEKILGSGLFNLRSLERADVGVVLGCMSSESQSPDQMPKIWLVRFWKYMNSISHPKGQLVKQEFLESNSLESFPLIVLRQSGGKEMVESLQYFQSNPAIVQSNTKKHMILCADFPGLLIVDLETLPTSIRQDEKSLSEVPSMKRFLKSIDLLARRNDKSLTEFVRETVKEKNIEILREVIVTMSQAASRTHVSLPNGLRDLPVWPRISLQQGFLAAREVIVAQNSAFVVPWAKDYHRFTEHNQFHQANSINDVRMLEDHVLPTLPDRIDEKIKTPYIRLVRAINGSFMQQKSSKRNGNTRLVQALISHRVAARHDGKLCLASDLYNHHNPIFSAAFRSEHNTRFLMVEARPYPSLWHGLGLRHCVDGKFKGGDYLACLNALERRMAGVHDHTLANDTEKVLYPLCTYDGSLRELAYTTWSSIADLAIFPIRPTSDHEPGFRRHRMEHLASQNCNLSLKEIVRREYSAVCWSQTTFALHEPSISSIQNIGSQGQPSCGVVWKHLAFLAQLAKSIDEPHVESFVEDLQRTYEFLLSNVTASKHTFSQPKGLIWFNADTTSPSGISLDVLRTSWTSLEFLLLDSPCNAPPMMTVQPFLGQFSTLLKEVGCKSLYYPPITPPTSHRPQTTFTLVRDLWKEDALTDVRFEAEGKTMAAHKIILASRSLYCKSQFHGHWSLVSTAKKIIKLEEMTYATLEILIESCYDENYDWASGMRVEEDDSPATIADKLDSLLDVLVAADRWIMPDLHADAQSQIITGIRYFVRPDNVEEVREVATEANATELSNYCHEFCLRNEEAVMLARVEEDYIT